MKMEALLREPLVESRGARRISRGEDRKEMLNIVQDTAQTHEGLGFSLDKYTETYAMMSPPRFGADAFIPPKENLTVGKVVAAVSQFFLMGAFAAAAIVFLASTLWGAATAMAVTAQIFTWFGFSTFAMVDSAILLKLAAAPVGIFVGLTVFGAALTKALNGMWNAYMSLWE